MDVFAFYQAIGVNPQDVVKRLGNVALMKKYLDKFYNDPSYLNLQQYLREKNYGEAFRAAHMIKGICLNLELLPLTELSVRLSEILRDYTPAREQLLLETNGKFTAAYRGLLEMIKELQ